LESLSAQEVLAHVVDEFHPRLYVACSFQKEASVILDMLLAIEPGARVFTLDTGVLFPETYETWRRIEERYDIEIDVYRGEWIDGLWQRDPDACCGMRKVEPLERALSEVDAWITGLRRDQWASRTDIRKVEIDHDHGGIVKLNPLAEWTEDEVWDYVREREIPYHPLYDRGYTSIGCAPCTRALAPGEQSRDGRWWWEQNAPKECGIHCAVETGGLEHELRALIGEDDE
jgi:phosphoadenylyl-sulfate reductase (thioredoxin)